MYSATRGQYKVVNKFIMLTFVIVSIFIFSSITFAGSNNPTFFDGETSPYAPQDSAISPYALQEGTFTVTGIQLVDPTGECNAVSVTVAGVVTGTTDDGGGMDVITFELWDDGTLMDSEDISVKVGRTASFSLTMGFIGLYGSIAPGVGVYAPELNWWIDPFYPMDQQGSCGYTVTGFYYPLGRADFDSECGTWLSRDSKNGGCYYAGYYHIGVDMMADYNSPVYGISNGTVYSISKNGWGKGNVAVIAKHTLSDATEFYAVYGHVMTSLKPGDPIEGGKPFAVVGKWPDGDHLHFGIIQPNTVPKAPFGKMQNSKWPDTNGFVDPIDFINTYSPE